MRKTTMTVAAFMVAAASYAATTPTNAGVEVKVKAGDRKATVELLLKKGTYGIECSKGATVEGVTYLDGTKIDLEKGKIKIGDKGAEVKVNLTVTASEGEQTIMVTVTPIDETWNKYVKELQNQESASFSLSRALPADKNYEKEWHDKLVDKGVELQDRINKLGIDEYNQYVDAGGKLADLEKELDAYEAEAKTYSENHKQYRKALDDWKNKIKYTELEEAWHNCTEEQQKQFKSAYEQARNKAEESYKNAVEDAYKNETAATSYTDAKIEEAIKAAQKHIDETAQNISTNNTSSEAYNMVQSVINARIKAYNDAVDRVYDKMIAPEPNTYDADYKEALEKLRTVLGEVNDVKAEADALNDEKKLTFAKADELITKLPAPTKFDTSVDSLIAKVERLRDAYVTSTKRITNSRFTAPDTATKAS